MADTVANINADVRAYLNDPSGVLFSDGVILPHINLSYVEFQVKARGFGLPVVKEVSSVVTITAGDKDLTNTDITDLITPIALWERPAGSSELFVLMTEQDWEPEVTLTSELRYWNFRENEIKFPGANANREVKVQYLKGLAALTGNSSVIGHNSIRPWLSAMTAATLAEAFGNSARAANLVTRADGLWDDFLTEAVKDLQSLPQRRKPFRRKRDSRL